MRRPTIELIGQRFGKLLVERPIRRDAKHAYFECKCDCGSTHVASAAHLRAGGVKSCGCARGAHISMAITKHGHAKTPTWRIWVGMRSRCQKSYDSMYSLYGARGISVCERWQSFENFLSDMGERPPGHSLDRIDSNGNYSPENCRWASPTQQVRNRRNTTLVTYQGRTIPLAEAAELSGLPINLIRLRLRRNWPQDRLFIPRVPPQERIDAAWRHKA